MVEFLRCWHLMHCLMKLNALLQLVYDNAIVTSYNFLILSQRCAHFMYYIIGFVFTVIHVCIFDFIIQQDIICLHKNIKLIQQAFSVLFFTVPYPNE